MIEDDVECRAGQRAGLGGFGPKTPFQPNPRVSCSGPSLPIIPQRVSGFRVGLDGF